MSHSFELALRVNQGEAEKLHVEVDDSDWQTLIGYLEDFDRLAATRMGGNCQIKVTFTFDARTGFSWSGEMPPEDDVAAFLHRLRPFVLNDERSNFNRVCNILGRAIAHPGPPPAAADAARVSRTCASISRFGVGWGVP